ncbi:helix-turn-helix domain-containing protein [Cohnella sp. GCM10027633]|uniref:helix-turn-helix domain-containing protein n=1 Tax=unclassified Cohnella TaxID=2636738 RepID=UPI003638E1C7
MGHSDTIIEGHSHTKKAAKAQLHHSAESEHFQGDFPFFVNRWEEGFQLREHRHAYAEIVYVMSGEGFHYVGDGVERTGKGRLYVLPVGTSHLFRPVSATGSNRLLVYNLCIRPAFIDELTAWIGRHIGGDAPSVFAGEPGTHLSLLDRRMELGSLFERLHREFTEKPSGYGQSMLSDVMHLAVRIDRLSAEAASPRAASASTGGAGRTGLLRLLEGMADRIAEPLTAESLADESGMSKRNFIRLFRKLTGMGFSAYLQHRRAELACRLLRDTDDSVDEIGRSVGYKDPGHFREVFRKAIGTTPLKYRLEANGK